MAYTHNNKTGSNPALNNLDALAKLMDAQFSVPGTRIRFGLDALLGLVPGLGDLATFVISAYMLMILARRGASGFLLARMVLNVAIDSLLGSIPLIGDLFDIAFKSNQRNMKLMHAHYVEGRHQGSAWKLIIPLLLVLVLMIVCIAWGAYSLFTWLFNRF